MTNGGAGPQMERGAVADARTEPNESILIIGCGDHARVVAEIFQSRGRAVEGCIELHPPAPSGSDAMQCLGDLDDPAPWISPTSRFVVAIGANDARARAFARCIDLGLEPVEAIHRHALLLGNSSVDAGAQICAGAIIGVAARVGPNAIVNTGASVDHDCAIGAHATVAPGARLGGRVTVGERAHVGIGATVREGLNIGNDAFIAAGAVVIRDVAPGDRVAGIPARPMGSVGRQTEDGEVGRSASAGS